MVEGASVLACTHMDICGTQGKNLWLLSVLDQEFVFSQLYSPGTFFLQPLPGTHCFLNTQCG